MPLPNGEPTAAEVIALSNRLLAQKSAPGWHDLLAIGERLKVQAREAVQSYKGTDKEELFDLVRRSQIAESFIVEFFGYIDWAVEQSKGLPGFQREDPRPPLITTKIPGSY
jgi:hypothetical protein